MCRASEHIGTSPDAQNKNVFWLCTDLGGPSMVREFVEEAVREASGADKMDVEVGGALPHVTTPLIHLLAAAVDARYSQPSPC